MKPWPSKGLQCLRSLCSSSTKKPTIPPAHLFAARMSSTKDNESRVPMTMRDFFFSDPFFKDSWDNFDKVREEMLKESGDFWKGVERDMKQMESSFSSMMSSAAAANKSIEQKSSSSSKESSSDSSKAVVPSGSADYSPWFFPRKWMLPKLFGSDDDGMMRSLDLFQHKDDQVIRVKDDDNKFEVSLDMHNFRPEDLKVVVKDSILTIEAKHEEKTDNRFESRQFSRSYTLPDRCEMDKVQSNLSSDGILVVSAPKKADPKAVSGSTAIPVEHK